MDYLFWSNFLLGSGVFCFVALVVLSLVEVRRNRNKIQKRLKIIRG